MNPRLGAAALCLAWPLARAAAEPSLPWPADAVDRAVLAELGRSATGLRQEGYPLPYYIGLRVSEIGSEDLRCAMGGPAFRGSQRRMWLTADVRVGGRELDNHPPGPAAGLSLQELPWGGGEFAVRHAVWAELDDRYKSAAAGFLRRQALRVRRGKADYETDDMSEEPPRRLDLPGPPPAEAARRQAERLCADLSAVFRAKPDLLSARVILSNDTARHRLFDTEGTRVRYGEGAVRLALDAEALTPDGMRVYASKAYLVPREADLPAKEALEGAARSMISDLEALQAAGSTSPFSAPALVDPSVGAAILQALATRLSGEQMRNPEGAQTFRDKLGKPVLPAFLTIEDDPTLREFRGTPLMGRYAVDDQGVPARRVTLVEGGVLREYLLSRYPVIGFPRSNGHGRAAPGRLAMGRTANLVVRSSVTYSAERLMGMLREECARRGKPYGLWIVKARTWRQQDRTGQQQAFRLMPTLVYLVEAGTGRRILVRDLDMVGTPLDLAGKILAAGDDPEAVNAFIDDASGSLPVATVVPSLLLAEVELQRADTKPEKPPALPAPTP